MPWSPAPSSSPPFFFLAFDAHGDVGRLAVQQHLDVGAVIGEAVLVVADVLDHIARDLGDQLAIDDRFVAVLAEQRRLAAAFAGDDDLVGGGKRLAAEPGVDLAVVGDAELDVVLEKGVEDGVGNLVADLVRMTFGNGLAGEQDNWCVTPQKLLPRALDDRAGRIAAAVSCSVENGDGQDVGTRWAGRRCRRSVAIAAAFRSFLAGDLLDQIDDAAAQLAAS